MMKSQLTIYCSIVARSDHLCCAKYIKIENFKKPKISLLRLGATIDI